jgi:uncharacterized protein
LAIELAGGEPLVNYKLFRDLVIYIRQKSQDLGRRVKIYVQTNGSAVTPKVVEFLREQDVIVGVSLDGPAEIHDAARPQANGRGSFERVIRGISFLRSGGVGFGVISVLTRHNVHHAERMVQFFSELNVNSVKINPVNLIGNAGKAWDEVGITGEEYFNFLDTFIEYTQSKEIQLREPNLSECIKNIVFRIHEYRCMRSNCGAGRSFFVTDANGDIFPCAHSTAIGSWKLGNIADAETAGGLVSLGAKNRVVTAISKRMVDRMPATSSCPWRHFCEGGCAVNAFKAHGTVSSKDPLCSFYEKMYPRLFERLASSPVEFQDLLDRQLGKGVAEIRKFSLTRNNRKVPIDILTVQ